MLLNAPNHPLHFQGDANKNGKFLSYVFSVQFIYESLSFHVFMKYVRYTYQAKQNRFFVWYDLFDKGVPRRKV